MLCCLEHVRRFMVYQLNNVLGKHVFYEVSSPYTEALETFRNTNPSRIAESLETLVLPRACFVQKVVDRVSDRSKVVATLPYPAEMRNIYQRAFWSSRRKRPIQHMHYRHWSGNPVRVPCWLKQLKKLYMRSL